MNLTAILGVLEFDLRRQATIPRIVSFIGLASFPAFLLYVLQVINGLGGLSEIVSLLLSFLIVQVGCGMVLLLTATTAISAELEGNTWIYLSTRANGRIAALVGKWLSALVQAMAVGTFATIAAMANMWSLEPYRLCLGLLFTMLLGCLCYASLFVAIGAWIQRRAMAFAVIYMLMVEGFLAWIPATINRFTVSYRLRSLLANWMDWEIVSREPFRELISTDPAFDQLFYLGIYLLVTLSIALVRVRFGEYPTHAEG